MGWSCRDRWTDRETGTERHGSWRMRWGAHRQSGRCGIARGPRKRETEAQSSQTKSSGMEGGGGKERGARASRRS